jgi:hypothetical protein
MMACTCGWCDAPATGDISARWRSVMSRKRGGSGLVFTGGPETSYPVCRDGAERLTGRYLKAKVK